MSLIISGGNYVCKKKRIPQNLEEKAKQLKLEGLNRRETRDRGRLEKEISILLDKQDNHEEMIQKIGEKEAERDTFQDQIKDLQKNVERDCRVSRQSPKLLSTAIIIPAHDNGTPAGKT